VIRFTPDDWLDVTMRPFDMAAPEANSYVEIAAPDLRLAAAVMLACAVLLLWRRRAPGGKPVLWLLALLVASFAVWLATTGNGRYFIAWLLLLGPLCVGLTRLLPMPGRAKLLVAGGLVAAQVFLVTQNSPWGAWSWLSWTDPPYFQIDTPPAEPATYVTIANISYSLIAPQFPPESRWISLAAGVSKRDAPVVDKLLDTSVRLILMVPAIPSQTLPNGQPSATLADALVTLLRPHGLFLRSPVQCQHLPSAGLARIGQRQGAQPQPGNPKKFGFWLCPLEYRPGAASVPSPVDPGIHELFEAVERLCPRFFPGGAAPMKITGGWLKQYDTDTKVYVLDDRPVFYKFWRSLNPVDIGTRQQLLDGRASIDCTKIRAPNWRRGGP
jgi:hypothetical protein